MAGLRTPVVIVNYKVYPEAVGKRAVQLTRELEAAGAGFAGEVVVCPNAIDLAAVVGATRLKVFAQHVDPLPLGMGTGSLPVEAARDAGAKGSLVNHAERRLEEVTIERTIARLRGTGLTSVVCSRNPEESQRLARFRPDAVAVEPPELIGGSVSVTTADPGVVRRSVEAVRKGHRGVLVLCGAGVKSGNDFRKALELGADGVLLASGIVTSKDPGKALRRLVEG